LVLCYCGWALNDGNGRAQLEELGENIDPEELGENIDPEE
jgi:hypothetical protein